MALSILTLHFLRFNVTRILTPLTALLIKATSVSWRVLTVLTIRQAPVFWSFDRRRFAMTWKLGWVEG